MDGLFLQVGALKKAQNPSFTQGNRMAEAPKKLEIKILNPEFYQKHPLPNYATSGSAAMDLRAAIEAPLQLEPRETVLIPTGLAIHIADSNLAALLLPRSGLGHKHGVVLGNLVGLIDADYQDEIKVSLWNRGSRTYQVLAGERIAQLMLVPIQRFIWTQVEAFGPPLDRQGGFGHSGRL